MTMRRIASGGERFCWKAPTEVSPRWLGLARKLRFAATLAIATLAGHRLPLEIERRIDKRDMRKRLGEVADQPLALRIVFLR